MLKLKGLKNDNEKIQAIIADYEAKEVEAEIAEAKSALQAEYEAERKKIEEAKEAELTALQLAWGEKLK